MTQEIAALTVEQLTGHQSLLLDDQLPLLPQAAAQFLKMQAAAKKDRIEIVLISGYRSYAEQLKLWERKSAFIQKNHPELNAKRRVMKILEYIALPGTSRHHFATEIDIIGDSEYPGNDPLSTCFFTEPLAPFNKLFVWLLKYAHRFGFKLGYPRDPSRSGFVYEPWHFSYAPYSKIMLQRLLQLPWRECLRLDQIPDGEVFDSRLLRIYELQFLLGVHLDLLPDSPKSD